MTAASTEIAKDEIVKHMRMASRSEAFDLARAGGPITTQDKRRLRAALQTASIAANAGPQQRRECLACA
jgi:hypothetical protein